MELLRIFGCDKTGGPSGCLHPSRPADSMNVILRAMRQVEIDDVTDVRDIDPTCRNVCRNEHAEDSAFKAFQRASAL
jgi:hypothetical protein